MSVTSNTSDDTIVFSRPHFSCEFSEFCLVLDIDTVVGNYRGPAPTGPSAAFTMRVMSTNSALASKRNKAQPARGMERLVDTVRAAIDGNLVKREEILAIVGPRARSGLAVWFQQKTFPPALWLFQSHPNEQAVFDAIAQVIFPNTRKASTAELDGFTSFGRVCSSNLSTPEVHRARYRRLCGYKYGILDVFTDAFSMSRDPIPLKYIYSDPRFWVEVSSPAKVETLISPVECGTSKGFRYSKYAQFSCLACLRAFGATGDPVVSFVSFVAAFLRITCFGFFVTSECEFDSHRQAFIEDIEITSVMDWELSLGRCGLLSLLY